MKTTTTNKQIKQKINSNSIYIAKWIDLEKLVPAWEPATSETNPIDFFLFSNNLLMTCLYKNSHPKILLLVAHLQEN